MEIQINKNIDNIQNNNKNENKNNKTRNPGVDLIRLISMYGIIINHLLYHGNGLNKYLKYIKELKFFHIILFWHNNGFALISGIVGYKTNKYSNLLYLWISVFFYSVGLHIYFQLFIKDSIIEESISVEFFPIIFHRYWYFTCYFGMYLFLPVINKGITILRKSEFKLIVISTLGIFSFWRQVKNPKNDVFHLNGGFSVLWLLIVYITGAYIGKYRIEYKGIKSFIFCFTCLLIYSFSSFLFYLSFNNKLYIGNGYFQNKIIMLLNRIMAENYNSPIKIIQSISITLIFLQIKYNNHLSRIISFFGRFVFGIYLLHDNKLVRQNILFKIFKNDPNNLNLYSTIILFLIKSLKIFLICIFIEYIRHLLFNILRIRKLCIYLEEFIIKY